VRRARAIVSSGGKSRIALGALIELADVQNDRCALAGAGPQPPDHVERIGDHDLTKLGDKAPQRLAFVGHGDEIQDVGGDAPLELLPQDGIGERE
jgi:hypothetical protein